MIDKIYVIKNDKVDDIEYVSMGANFNITVFRYIFGNFSKIY